MKSSKLTIILSSLVILMMCLSVVSATVENASNDAVSDGITNVGFDNSANPNPENPGDDSAIPDPEGSGDDSAIPDPEGSGDDSGILNTKFEVDVEPFGDKVLLAQLKDEKENTLADAPVFITIYDTEGNYIEGTTKTTDSNGLVEYDISKLPKGEYVANFVFGGNDKYKNTNEAVSFSVGELIPTKFEVDVEPFGDKVLSAQLKDEKDNTLAYSLISVSLYDAKGNFIKDTPMTTDKWGLVEYDISKLPKGKYTAVFRFAGNDKYESTASDHIPFTVEGKNPIHKKDKKDKKDPKDIDMENTGAPILALTLGLLIVAGIGYRRF